MRGCVLGTAALALLVGAAPGRAGEPRSLEQRVAELEARVAQLERTGAPIADAALELAVIEKVFALLAEDRDRDLATVLDAQALATWLRISDRLGVAAGKSLVEWVRVVVAGNTSLDADGREALRAFLGAVNARIPEAYRLAAASLRESLARADEAERAQKEAAAAKEAARRAAALRRVTSAARGGVTAALELDLASSRNAWPLVLYGRVSLASAKRVASCRLYLTVRLQDVGGQTLPAVPFVAVATVDDTGAAQDVAFQPDLRRGGVLAPAVRRAIQESDLLLATWEVELGRIDFDDGTTLELR